MNKMTEIETKEQITKRKKNAYPQNEPETKIKSTHWNVCNAIYMSVCLSLFACHGNGIETKRNKWMMCKKSETEMYRLHDFGMLVFGIQIKRL